MWIVVQDGEDEGQTGVSVVQDESAMEQDAEDAIARQEAEEGE